MSSFDTLKERSKNLLISGGITAMTGAAILGVGGSVFAQDDSSPTAGTGETSEASDPATEQSGRDAEYAAFLDTLAANLGLADGATIDAALRTTMKQLIDERLAAGEISADLATELRAAIDGGDYPVRIHGPGVGGFGGPMMGDDRDFGGRGDRNGDRHGPVRDGRQPCGEGHGPGRGDRQPSDAGQDDPVEDPAPDDTLTPISETPSAGGSTTA